jgi:sec-independent protein translocase protein TatC
MTFTEHLRELRSVIIRSGITVIVAFFVCYAFSDYIYFIISKPLRSMAEDAPQWTVLNPLEGFIVKIRLAFFGSLLVAFPVIIWQICSFVFPGLKPNERRVVRILIYGCSLLACVGVATAYFGVFPLVLPYLLEWNPEGVVVQLRMSETLSIIIKGLVGFAIAFEFPMAVLILVYMGLLTPETLKKYRRFAIVGMALLAAMFTPPDPFSMVVMLLPLAGLYEVSIWVSYIVVRRKKKTAENESGEDKASKDKSGEDKASEDKASEVKAIEDKASEDKASEDKASEDKASEDDVNEDDVNEDKAGEDKSS